MIRSISLTAVIGLACLLESPPPAFAGRFDYIYIDHMRADMGPGGGFTFLGVALIVNTGTTNITATELNHTIYEVTASQPGFFFYPFVNNAGAVAPILPGEAVGSVSSETQFLVDLVQPGETFRNTWPVQFLALQVLREDPVYIGEVRFDVKMTMGGEQATFSVLVNMRRDGVQGYTFYSAARVSSAPPTTATSSTTWGGVKALYY